MTHFPSLEGKIARPATSKDQQKCMLDMSCLSGWMRICKMVTFHWCHVSFSQVARLQLTKQLKMTKQPGTHLKQTSWKRKTTRLSNRVSQSQFLPQVATWVWHLKCWPFATFLTWMETSRYLVYRRTWITAFGRHLPLEIGWILKPCRTGSKTA